MAHVRDSTGIPLRPVVLMLLSHGNVSAIFCIFTCLLAGADILLVLSHSRKSHRESQLQQNKSWKMEATDKAEEEESTILVLPQLK